MIPVFRPSMGQEEIDAVAEVIRSGWIGLGPKTKEFEDAFAEYVGAKHAIAVNSGTAALHLALSSLQPGDEVLVSPVTFVSTIHAILYNGAIPVFVDIEPDTLNMNVCDAEAKITNCTTGILPVHYGGHPCDMDKIMDLANEHRLLVVEDAAHACGAEYKGRKIGSIGDFTCFSFHAVKNLATGDGGMITTNRDQDVERLRQLRWCGIDQGTAERMGEQYRWYYEVKRLGFKCHMNDIAAAIGLVQLNKLRDTNYRRKVIAYFYTQCLRELPWMQCPVEGPDVDSAWHNYVIKTPYRDKLHRHLAELGISTGVHYLPIHFHPYYRGRFKAKVPIAEQVWGQLLTLPLYPDMTIDDVEYIIDAIRSFEP